MLRRPEHLNRLLGALDGHLVEQDGVRLAGHVRRENGQQRGEAVLVVRQGVAEGVLCRAAARSDDQVDMGNFIASPTRDSPTITLVIFAMNIASQAIVAG
jgi:hypothetical protein